MEVIDGNIGVDSVYIVLVTGSLVAEDCVEGGKGKAVFPILVTVVGEYEKVLKESVELIPARESESGIVVRVLVEVG